MSGQAKTINVGIIGCGIAAERHLEVLARTPGVRVAAAADVDGERLARVAKRFGIANTATDYQALLGRNDAEAVVVAVPTQFHAEVGVAALEAGRHLFMENRSRRRWRIVTGWSPAQRERERGRWSGSTCGSTGWCAARGRWCKAARSGQ